MACTSSRTMASPSPEPDSRSSGRCLAHLEADHAVDLVVAGGEHDDGNVTGGPEPPADLEAVDLAW